MIGKRLTRSLLFLLFVSMGTVISIPSLMPMQQKKPLTNADVVQMAKDGFTDLVIINTIRTSETQFNLSKDLLYQLKDSGISQKIIEAMQDAEARKLFLSQPLPESPLARQPVSGLPLAQPSALIVLGETKQEVPTSQAQIAVTKGKGDNLALLAAEGAVREVLTMEAARAAAGIMIATGSRTLLFGILGALPEVIARLPIPKRKVTLVWALPGNSSMNTLKVALPRFEVLYADIPGVDPDIYQPAIVKCTPTKDNWRLVGATKAAANAYESEDAKWKVYEKFVEDRIPSRVNRLGRGHVQIEPNNSLDPGEYAMVLRPISPTMKVSGKNICYGQAEGLIFNTAFSFSIRSN